RRQHLCLADRQPDGDGFHLLDQRPADHADVVEGPSGQCLRRCGRMVFGSPIRGEVAGSSDRPTLHQL
ncbi:MAG TPA: hypothetical protein VIH06_14210, partial [Ilumatobacteraceae bacterium]